MTYPNIEAFSYSRWETWNQCPRKAYYQFVAKYATGPKPDAMQRGIDAHEICAAIYRGEWPNPEVGPVSLEWRSILARQRGFYGTDIEAELQVSFDKDWNRTPWFDKQTVYRAAFDGLAYTPQQMGLVQIFEHKTGKVRGSHHDQADWYAGVATLIAPDAAVFHVNIQYLDNPATSLKAVMQKRYTMNEATAHLAAWRIKAGEMMADTEFPTRAGPLCRYCPFRNSNKGPCHLG
jgi:hypothetical protein